MAVRDLKNEYKELFDSIHAPEKLKAEILDAKPKKYNIRPVIAAVTVAAAGFTIFTAVKFSRFEDNDDGIISEVISTEKASRSAHDATNETTVPKPAENEIISSLTPPPEQNISRPGATQKPKKKTTDDYAREAIQGLDIQNDVASENMTDPTLKPTEAPKQNESVHISIPDYSSENTKKTEETKKPRETAKSSRNSAAYADATLGKFVLNSMSALRAAQRYSQDNTAVDSKIIMGEYHTEEWDNDRYFNYIGTDILKKVSLPNDFSFTGDDAGIFTINANGVPLNDLRVFPFDGENGRTVRILVSTDTSSARTYLSSSDIALSDINGTAAAVFGENGVYKCYMVHNGVSYTTDSSGLNEEDLFKLLASLTDNEF